MLRKRQCWAVQSPCSPLLPHHVPKEPVQLGLRFERFQTTPNCCLSLKVYISVGGFSLIVLLLCSHLSLEPEFSSEVCVCAVVHYVQGLWYSMYIVCVRCMIQCVQFVLYSEVCDQVWNKRWAIDSPRWRTLCCEDQLCRWPMRAETFMEQC